MKETKFPEENCTLVISASAGDDSNQRDIEANNVTSASRSSFVENTESSGEGELGDGVDESAKRVGRVHDDEGAQFGRGARRFGS